MLTIIDTDADISPRTISPEDERIAQFAAKAARGDEAAFGELYGMFAQRVFNLVLRSVRDRGTAEDLCQEIWLKVHKEIGCLRTPEAFRSWVYRIASHACIDFARSARSAHLSDEDLTEEVANAHEPMPEDAAIRGSEVRMVWETLATMAPRQGIALYLKQVDGRSYEEIASILDCSRETVESLLFRARQSFVRAYDRVQSSSVERCLLFHQVVAGVIDDEPTLLQKSAIQAHLQECMACRTELPEMAAAAKGYSLLPLLPASNVIAWQTIVGGSAMGGGLVVPAATGGIVAGLSLKTKLAGLISVLALGVGGAATTGVVNVPLVPDSVAIFDNGTPPAQAGLDTRGGSGNGNGEQALGGGANPSPSSANTGGSGANAGNVNPRDAGSPGGNGTSNPGTQPGALPPAAPTGSPNDGGGTPAPDEPTSEGPLGTLLNDPLGTLDGLTGGALGNTLGALDGALEGLDGTLDDIADTVDGTLGNIVEPVDDLAGGVIGDTLDTLLPPDDGESGPVGDIIDGIDDTLDGVLPGEQEPGGGLLGDILDPLLSPSVTPPPSSPPAPEATPPPPPCLLGLLC